MNDVASREAEPTQADILIIGGGPTGLFAAYYAGFRGLKARIIDSLPELGGQVAAMYPEKLIFDVAGFPKVTGRELVDRLVEQAGRYSPGVHLEEPVRLIRRIPDGTFVVATERGDHAGRVVLVTAGIGMFQPKRLAAFSEYEDRGLVYFVKEMAPYRGKRILIVGGGDSAVDWALNLHPIAAQVFLIHRRDTFRAHEDSIRQLRESSVIVKTPYELKRIRGDGEVEGAVIYHNTTRQEEALAVDAVIAAVGFVADIGPLATWGLELDGHSIVVNSRMETSETGIYAAGDIVSYPGKVRLIATDFGEAATAINNAAHFINPGTSVFPGYSTHKG
jgi:ferredoxin/flavodoxin---NADP+ reductase